MSNLVNPVSVTNTIYTVGGTLRLDRGVYIMRKADQELLDLCLAGEYAYMLTARQLGKSSLMERTAKRLEEAGVRTVKVDPTAWGSNITAEQWVKTLLRHIAQRLKIVFDLATWWQEHEEFSVTSRMTTFFRDELLSHLDGRVVIFLDEIDFLIGQPFADDFFAGLRSLYNERNEHPELGRLSFVLIGVALPSELISDPKHTPFNIAKRVDLSDFTLEEAKPLAVGFGLAEKEAMQTLGWVLVWTSGHPYLTQRICKEIADRTINDHDISTDDKALSQTRMTGKAAVDQIVRDLFFSIKRGEDDNLKFVEKQLLERTPLAARVPLLQTYREIVVGKRVKDEERSVVKDNLKLSGVVRREHGALQVRNRIYAQAFNRQWVDGHLPPVPWRKWLAETPIWARWLMIAVCLLGIGVVVAAGWAIERSVDANNARATAQAELLYKLQAQSTAEAQATQTANAEKDAEERQVEIEQQRTRIVHQTNLAMSRKLAAQSTEMLGTGDTNLSLLLALEALTRTQTAEAVSALASVQQSQFGQLLLSTSISDSISNVRWDGNEAKILVSSNYGSVSVNDAVNGDHLYTLYPPIPLLDTKLEDQNKFLLQKSYRVVEVWDKKSTQPVVVLHHEQNVIGVKWGKDDTQVLTWEVDDTVNLWNATDGKLILTIENDLGDISDVRQSYGNCGDEEQDEIEAIWTDDIDFEYATCWDMSGTELRTLATINIEDTQSISKTVDHFTNSSYQAIWNTAINADASRVWTHRNGAFILWDGNDGSMLSGLKDGQQVGVSDDGEFVLIANCHLSKCVLDIWDSKLSKHIGTVDTENVMVDFRFSEDGKKLLTWSQDSTIQIWDIQSSKRLFSLDYKKPISQLHWSSDSRRVIIFSEEDIYIWETASEKETIASGLNVTSDQTLVGWSKDGKKVLINRGNVAILDVDSGQQLLEFASKGSLVGAKWNQDESQVLTWGSENNVTIWDANNGEPLFVLPDTSYVPGAQWNKDESQILTWNYSGPIGIWDAISGNPLFSLVFSLDKKESISGVQWNKDESQVLAWGEDGTIKVWQVTNKSKLINLDIDGIHQINGEEMIWNTYRDRAVTWQMHNLGTSVWLWDVRSGTKLVTLNLKGDLRGVQWSSDSKRLLTWTDKDVTVWDAGSGEQLRLIQQDNVSSAAWSKDGKHLIVASYVVFFAGGYDPRERYTVEIWDVSTTNQPIILDSVGGLYYYLWNEEGSQVFTNNINGIVDLWDANTGKKVATLSHQHENEKIFWESKPSIIGVHPHLLIRENGAVELWDRIDLYRGAFPAQITHQKERILDAYSNKNGEWALIQTVSDTTIMWDVKNNKQFVLDRKGEILGFEKDDADHPLLIWSIDGTVEIWNKETTRLLGIIKHDGVNGAKWNKDYSQILTWGADDTARIWDKATGKQLAFFAHQNAVVGAAWNKSEDKVLTWSKDNTVGLWDVSLGKRLITLRHQDEIDGAVLEEPDNKVLTWSKDRTIGIWDTNSGERLVTINIGGRVKAIFGVLSHLFVWKEDDIISSWDIDTYQQVSNFQLKGDVLLTQTGTGTVLIANNDGTIMEWDVVKGEKLLTQNIINGVAVGLWSENGDYLLTLGYDFELRIWDAKTGEPISILDDEYRLTRTSENRFGDIQWDVNNHRLQIKIADTFFVWDIQTGKLLSTTVSNQDDLNTSEGSKAITWGGKTVSVWDESHINLLASLSLVDLVDYAKLNQEGNQVLLYQNYSLILWTIDKNQLWLEGCESTAGQLTQEEWQKYLDNEPYRPTCPVYTRFLGAAKRRSIAGDPVSAEQIFARANQIAAKQDGVILDLDPHTEAVRYALPPLAGKANAAALDCKIDEAMALYQQVKALDPDFFQGEARSVVKKLAAQAGCSFP